ncbi:MAG: hypothetical protein ETSY2_03455 [Candidatus Entotheonella gemina]|uniref:Uncharacterized protein n=1 Tax=Candidatus Entotheonella gemina TaxID=1429439 RepID=W4MEY8_9BACT|nr:MAG: hypothetical protein ETSY2_03455 [Candidatus Entotheonella gemina]
MLPQTQKTAQYRRLSGSVVLACVWLYVVPGQAWALETARELVMRGDQLLHQARAEPEGKPREQRLSQAVDAFSKAYGLGRRQAKMHALVGVAQGYLLMRQAPSHFPFLWSAPPLKRAEKSLQHVLALAPNQAAANLLMGIALWRRAELATSSAELRGRSEHYLRQAARAGMNVQLPASEPAPGRFAIGDTILALQYADARGTGRIEDLIFIYTRQPETHCYGMVVSDGTAYPLVSDADTGRMASTAALSALDVVLQTAGHPLITLMWEAEGSPNRVQFQWNGTSFEALQAAAAHQ